ncbi:hypothetical protein Tco_0828971 [Tanacetum coccineum]
MKTRERFLGFVGGMIGLRDNWCMFSEDDFEIVKVRDHVGFYVVGKDGTRTWYPDILAHGEKPIQGTQFVSVDQAYSFYVAYGKKAGFDVRRGGEYKAVGFVDATTKYFHCSREGFLPNTKEKSGVNSLDVDISEHSEISDGFERFIYNCESVILSNQYLFNNIVLLNV